MTASKNEKEDETSSKVDLKKGSTFRQKVSGSASTKALPIKALFGSVISNPINLTTEKHTKKSRAHSSQSSDPWDERTCYNSPNVFVVGTPNDNIEARPSISRTHTTRSRSCSNTELKRTSKDDCLEKVFRKDSNEKGPCCSAVKTSIDTPQPVQEKLLGECCNKNVESKYETSTTDEQKETSSCGPCPSSSATSTKSRVKTEPLGKNICGVCKRMLEASAPKCMKCLKEGQNQASTTSSTLPAGTSSSDTRSTCQACIREEQLKAAQPDSTSQDSKSSTTKIDTHNKPISDLASGCVRPDSAPKSDSTSSSTITKAPFSTESSATTKCGSTSKSGTCVPPLICSRTVCKSLSKDGGGVTSGKSETISPSSPKGVLCSKPASVESTSDKPGDTETKPSPSGSTCRQSCTGHASTESTSSKATSTSLNVPPSSCSSASKTDTAGVPVGKKVSTSPPTGMKQVACPPPCSKRVPSGSTSSKPSGTDMPSTVPTCEKPSSNITSGKPSSTSETNMKPPSGVCPPSCARPSSAEPTSSEPSSTSETSKKPSSSVCQRSCASTSETSRKTPSSICQPFCAQRSSTEPTSSKPIPTSQTSMKASHAGVCDDVCKPCSTRSSDLHIAKKSVSKHSSESGSTSGTGGVCKPSTCHPSGQRTFKKSVAQDRKTLPQPGVCQLCTDAGPSSDSHSTLKKSSTTSSSLQPSVCQPCVGTAHAATAQTTHKEPTSTSSSTNIYQPCTTGTASHKSNSNVCQLCMGKTQQDHNTSNKSGSKSSGSVTGNCQCSSSAATRSTSYKSAVTSSSTSSSKDHSTCVTIGRASSQNEEYFIEQNQFSKLDSGQGFERLYSTSHGAKRSSNADPAISMGRAATAQNPACDSCGGTGVKIPSSDDQKTSIGETVTSQSRSCSETALKRLSNEGQTSGAEGSVTSENPICSSSTATGTKGPPRDSYRMIISETVTSQAPVCVPCVRTAPEESSSKDQTTSSGGTVTSENQACEACGGTGIRSSSEIQKTNVGEVTSQIPTCPCSGTAPSSAAQTTGTSSTSQTVGKCNLLESIPECGSTNDPLQAEVKAVHVEINRMIDEGSPTVTSPDGSRYKKYDCFYEIEPEQRTTEYEPPSCCNPVGPSVKDGCPYLKCSVPTTTTGPKILTTEEPPTCPPGFVWVPDEDLPASVGRKSEEAAAKKTAVSQPKRKGGKNKRAPKGLRRRTVNEEVQEKIQCSKVMPYRGNRSSVFREIVKPGMCARKKSSSSDSQERRLRGRINYRDIPHVPVRLTHGEHLRRRHNEEYRERLLARLAKRRRRYMKF